MSIRNILDDFSEINNFEIRIFKNEAYVYYYDKIIHFDDNMIMVNKGDKKVEIKGKKLVIKTMYKEYLIISGNINSINIYGDQIE